MRIIYITTVSSTVNAFFKSHIEMLFKNGHQVDIASNIDFPLDDFYKDLGCEYYQIGFSRSPFSIDNIKAYRQLKKVIENGNYDIVHCHTPNAAVITRLACRKLRKKNGLKVFYTAHGFHFYKGAPKLNWIIYYPVEKFCSRFTDKLITINKEDYKLAVNKFKPKEVHYVPGVGINLSKFGNLNIDRMSKRQSYGIPKDALLLLSVGELNDNKNHQIVLRSLAKINDSNIHYAIAGIGDKYEYLLELANSLGISERVHLLGFIKDIEELYAISDIFCFPSKREGLSVSLMEAMASGLPVICSSIRGNIDLINNPDYLFNPFSEEQCETVLKNIIGSDLEHISKENINRVLYFSKETVLEKMREIYGV